MADKHQFAVKAAFEVDSTTLDISGSIDETAKFPDVRNEGRITINLEGVTRINSVGTRIWCMWMQKFRAPADVILMGCPPIMVKNFRSIRGFLSDRCRVFSFGVPFYSEISGERKDFMAIWGKHYDSKGDVKLPQVLDSQGRPMVLDVIPEQYFLFLKI